MISRFQACTCMCGSFLCSQYHYNSAVKALISVLRQPYWPRDLVIIRSKHSMLQINLKTYILKNKFLTNRQLNVWKGERLLWFINLTLSQRKKKKKTIQEWVNPREIKILTPWNDLIIPLKGADGTVASPNIPWWGSYQQFQELPLAGHTQTKRCRKRCGNKTHVPHWERYQMMTLFILPIVPKQRKVRIIH